jgi:D-xylose transport system substrate-binding protein
MMTKAGRGAIAVTFGAALVLAGCASNPPAKEQIKVGVLLPSEDTAARWEQVDNPVLDNLFKGDDYAYSPEIENVADEPAKAAAAATEMINGGSRVLVYAAANRETEAAITSTAKARGIPTVGYDWAGTGSSADYAVALDYRKIGELEGRGIIRGIRSKAGATVVELQSGDASATQLAEGQHNILDSRFDTHDYRLVAREKVDPATGAGPVLTKVLDANGGQVDGVLAATDEIAQASMEVLRQRGLAGKVTVTGYGASADSLKAVLRGEQFMTAFTPPADQDAMVAKLARALAVHDQATVDQIAPPAAPGQPRVVRVAPVSVTLDNINRVFTSGAADSGDVCEGDLTLRCNQLSIS